jgi:glutamine synthetase
MQSYKKIVAIEGRTCVDMALHQILPAALHYSSDLAKSIIDKKAIGVSFKAEQALVERLSAACDRLYDKCQDLTEKLSHIPDQSEEAANYMSQVIVPAMETLREDADLLEQLTDKSYWPYPTYSDILFY